MEPVTHDDEPPPYAPYIPPKPPGISSRATSQQHTQITVEDTIEEENDIADSEAHEQPQNPQEDARARVEARAEHARAISSALPEPATSKRQSRGCCGGKRKWYWLFFSLLFVIFAAAIAIGVKNVAHAVSHAGDPDTTPSNSISNSTASATASASNSTGSATAPASMPIMTGSPGIGG
jgi:hypothetical protein